MPKICDFETCRKYANYGAHHSNPTRCKEHKGEWWDVLHDMSKENLASLRYQYKPHTMKDVFNKIKSTNELYDELNNNTMFFRKKNGLPSSINKNRQKYRIYKCITWGSEHGGNR